jgi:hypothetical protein
MLYLNVLKEQMNKIREQCKVLSIEIRQAN